MQSELSCFSNQCFLFLLTPVWLGSHSLLLKLSRRSCVQILVAWDEISSILLYHMQGKKECWPLLIFLIRGQFMKRNEERTGRSMFKKMKRGLDLACFRAYGHHFWLRSGKAQCKMFEWLFIWVAWFLWAQLETTYMDVISQAKCLALLKHSASTWPLKLSHSKSLIWKYWLQSSLP